jgi:glycosyltransferase involved in cell wall biosynthesis
MHPIGGRLKLMALGLNNPAASIHVSGFYGHLIYIEWLFVFTAKLINRNVVYELRAGGVDTLFRDRGLIYRAFFKSTVTSAKSVLCQGKNYLNFLEENFKVKAYYYPNFVSSKLIFFTTNENRDQAKNLILIYFGRIHPKKNIELTIDVLSILIREGINAQLFCIGEGESEYLNFLMAAVKNKQVSDQCYFLAPLTKFDLFKYVKNAHFFIFPTRELREGHSNSLTEAMSFGVVPIASNCGFNETIINDPRLIISEQNPEKYAFIIKSIWLTGRWTDFSAEMRKRVLENYTEKAIKNVIINVH